MELLPEICFVSSGAPTYSTEPEPLTEQARERFLRYARKLCDLWGHPDPIIVQSASNFPADAGIASSASSFSALTMAVASLLRRPESTEELARLSRAASGSSCRSFFGPWCVWDGERIGSLEFPLGPLLHMVVIVDAGRKSVSSSEAHRRVLTSPEFAGRPDRARSRLQALCEALEHCDWRSAHAISAAEYIDMHTVMDRSSRWMPGRTFIFCSAKTSGRWQRGCASALRGRTRSWRPTWVPRERIPDPRLRQMDPRRRARGAARLACAGVSATRVRLGAAVRRRRQEPDRTFGGGAERRAARMSAARA